MNDLDALARRHDALARDHAATLLRVAELERELGSMKLLLYRPAVLRLLDSERRRETSKAVRYSTIRRLAAVRGPCNPSALTDWLTRLYNGRTEAAGAESLVKDLREHFENGPPSYSTVWRALSNCSFA